MCSVGYWEAAKWVAKIRDYADNNTSKPVLLKTSMTSGHLGEGGRHQHLKAAALEYAFFMKMMGT
jgi:oligopeptidase B